MAHKKAGGSTALGRDSESRRLGVKLFGGQKTVPGAVIVRQRGTSFRPGNNVRKGSDDTLYAAAVGTVAFQKKKVSSFTGKKVTRNIVYVLPS